ncbi:hypothetical protein KIPB_009391, partial [Kipferlia bialata]|eukprot:g9391.t1
MSVAASNVYCCWVCGKGVVQYQAPKSSAFQFGSGSDIC